MNDNRKALMLQRLPAILAVTAGSYGLDLQAAGKRKHRGPHRKNTENKPAAAHRQHAVEER